MRPIRALLILLAALAPAGAAAQIVASPAPEKVAVAVYRDQQRGGATAMELGYLGGFAFVSETRTVTIPAGRATVRFEGVAAGMLPESAIVTGLPDGVREKNLDADLLSPGSLYARSFGRPVTLHRTRDGHASQERAIIRSGPDGAMIVQTRDGFFAADCTPGERERLSYDAVPEGLSARPTLSVELESPSARTVTLTLSYLAWGFDWQANYVATMRPDGRADLFAWLTLASSDSTSFADAEAMAIAGRVRKGTERRAPVSRKPLYTRCYFRDVMPHRYRGGSDVVDSITADDMSALPAPSVARALQRVSGVSANRFAAQEELGDLKLYRVPMPTTIAARGQKQVALLAREKVPVEVIHSILVSDDKAYPAELTLRAQNRKEKGLGLPLPAGQVTLFEPRGGEPLLIGEGRIEDKAVNEEVEVSFARATQVAGKVTVISRGEHLLTITNARPFPVRVEASFSSFKGATHRFSRRLARKDGSDLWAVTLPANGTASLRYGLVRPKDD